MEAIMQNRRESFVYRVYQDENRHHEQRDRFFQQERLCQYVPYLDQTESSFLSSDACRQLISQLIWPRLVVIRVKSVLAALMPLMNLSDDGTFGVCLHGVSSVLSPLGWVLHGLRLLINTLQLLRQAMPDGWISNTGQEQAWHTRVGVHVQNNGVAMGNDLIWMLTAIAPTDLQFTSAFLLVDVLWLSGRAWLEMRRLKGLCDGTDATMDNHLFSELERALAQEQHKFILNLTNLLSISAIAIMKKFVLPSVFPVLAVNPWLLLAFSLLSLVITIASHFLGKALVGQKACNAPEETDSTSVSSRGTSPLSFFRDLQPLNEKDICQPTNATCAS